MRPAVWQVVPPIIVVLLILAFVLYRNARLREARDPSGMHVILIGASIAQAWHLDEWSARVKQPRLSVESVAEWQFDKTSAVEAVLRRPAMKFELSGAYVKSFVHPPVRPDVVILKECSAYFPGPLSAFQNSMREWVTRLLVHRFQVALATVVPVTAARAARDPGKQEALLSFNRWLRGYAREQWLALIDLESALRDRKPGSYLRDDFAAPDGSHLNSSAYRVLDQLLLESLCDTAGCTVTQAPSIRGEP